MPVLLRTRGINPLQVPEVPVELDQSHPLANGLIGLWLLNDGTARDLSGTGNNGSLISGPSVVAGPMGPTLDLNSASTQYVSVPDSSALNTGGGNTGELSFVAWVTTPTLPTAFWFQKGSGNYAQFGVRSNGKIFLYTSFGSYDGSGSNTLATGATYCVAATISHVTATGYVNAGLDASYAMSSPPGSLSGYPLNIGAGSSGASPWNGTIGPVTFWNRALSAQEIAWLYAEPFAMLRPTRRISFGFVPSSGNAATGSATLGPMAAAGQVVETDIASGVAKLGPITASGQTTETNAVSGLAALGPVKASGQASQTDTATGLASLGPIAAKGTIPTNAAGMAALGPIKAAATAVQTDVAAGASTLSQIKAVGSLIAANGAVGTAQLGPFAAAGQTTQTDEASGLAALGPIAASGELSGAGEAIGNASLGPISASGVATQTNSASVLAGLAAMSAAGTISQIIIASGAAAVVPAAAASVVQTCAATAVVSLGLLKAFGVVGGSSFIGVGLFGPISAVANLAVVGRDFAWSAALPPESLSVALPPEMLSVALPPGD